MAKPNSRKTLKEYVLRRLGSPVVQVNVPDIQLEDLLDDAIQHFHEYHFDGNSKVYYSHQITSTDVTNGYVELPDAIMSVTRVFPLHGDSTGNIFDIRYQLSLNDVYGLRTFDLQNYNIVMQYLAMVQDNLQGEHSYQFNQIESRLYIWDEKSVALPEGLWLMLEVFQMTDPEEFTKAYNNDFLKEYYYLLVKRQWGNNLKKFDGMALPGGITLNGQKIYDEAVQELKEFEDSIFTKYQLPPTWFMG